MTYAEAMEHIARSFEVVGVAIMAIGGLLALYTGFRDIFSGGRFFDDVRRGFGRPLILGLEVLVAADIIQTITVDTSLESVAALGILVLVRVILSLSLDMEVDGILPWRRVQTEAILRAAVQDTDEPDESGQQAS